MKKVIYYCDFCKGKILEKEVYMIDGMCVDVMDEEAIIDMAPDVEDLSNETFLNLHFHKSCYMCFVKSLIKRSMQQEEKKIEF